MFWFKNAMIYRLTKTLEWNLDDFQAALEKCEFHPCAQGELSKFGWKNPLKESEQFFFHTEQQFLVVAQKEEKILPAQVIKKELDNRVAELEEKEQRKLKKTEKQALKDDVIAVLLPRAFSKIQQTAIWIDTEKQLVIVDTSSAKRAEDALALLRKTLGSLPVVPLSFAQEPREVMTNWLINDETPQWLTVLEDAELKSSRDEAVIRCKKQDLNADEVLSLLESGKFVTKLALDWEAHLSFVLNEDCTLSRLKFADELREKNDDFDKEAVEQRFEADMILMTGTLSQLIDHLLDDFGGEKERL